MMLIGSGKRSAWLIAIASEVVWIAYGAWLRQLGLMLVSCLYGAVYFRNWRKCATR